MLLESKKLDVSLYKRVLDSIPLGFIVADTKGLFMSYNDVAKTYFETELNTTSDERWKGDYGFFSLDKKIKYNKEDAPLQKALAGEVIIHKKLYLVTHTYPQGFYVKMCAYPFYGKNNVITGAVILFEDITAEQQLYINMIQKLEDIKTYITSLQPIHINND